MNVSRRLSNRSAGLSSSMSRNSSNSCTQPMNGKPVALPGVEQRRGEEIGEIAAVAAADRALGVYLGSHREPEVETAVSAPAEVSVQRTAGRLGYLLRARRADVDLPGVHVRHLDDGNGLYAVPGYVANVERDDLEGGETREPEHEVGVRRHVHASCLDEQAFALVGRENRRPLECFRLHGAVSLCPSP